MAVRSVKPELTKVATEYNYLAAMDLAEGLFKPEISNQVVQRFGIQDITGIMSMLGNENQVNNIKISHYEEDRIHGVFRLSASAASAAGTSAQLAFTAGSTTAAGRSQYQGQDPYPGDDVFNTYLPQAYDVLEVNGFQMIVTSAAGGAFSARAIDSSQSIPAIAVTDDIIVIGSALPEGSGGVESRNSQLLSYTNYLQIFRRSHKVTGTAQNTATWVELQGKDGQKGYYWHVKGIGDEYRRFRNEREATLLVGKGLARGFNNAAGFDAAGSLSYGDMDTVTMTKGLIPQISADGNVEGYGSASAFGLTDIENMVINLNKFRGARENMLAVGLPLSLEIDALFRGTAANGTFDAAAQGGIQFQAFSGMENQQVKFEFDAFSYGGYKFAVKVLDIFSDPNFLGYSGGIYKDLGIVIPLDNTVTYNDMNKATSTYVPSLRVNYLGDRKMKEWLVGVGPGVSNTNNDYFEVNFLSHVGLEAFALNRFGLFVKE